MKWCARELANVEVCLRHAHELGMHDLVWQVPAALQGFFNLSKRVAAQYSTHALGLTAARECGSAEGIALMHLGISAAQRFWKNDGQAIDDGLEALEGFRALKNRRFEGIVLSNVAMSYVYIGWFGKAYEFFAESLAAAQEVGDRHAEAWALTNLGAAQRRDGLLDDSLSALRRAAEIRTAIDDLDGEAWTRAELGRTCSDLGLSDAAEAAFERSIALHLAHGNTYGHARALDQLGSHFERTGQHDRAREVWEEALPLFTALRGSDAARLRLNLARLGPAR
ncbi:tetratricopeptide repeat protein [Lentzea sp. PSKA42]|uniref:Tetratricopeptide repeat protein n=1 Tax=Lentzea indica TaxID=2604800 RepID=A0ABX1FGP7_9PSEU|nr:tetratricopeptide repeat protein [Lentzea indica]NKE58143.1 tetratricopeptide repeat protein [Lentzea indica]